ncbi:hypothetical protein LCGC14_1337870 [marine sediment metagenome]|uniref:Uncharacterized protein n=1 Tax=marine sediment metagenome TaxID=412755 RepID=A0A0F9NGV7_9ZZZZ
MKDKPWDRDIAWIMMKNPSNLNAYKEAMYYQSG